MTLLERAKALKKLGFLPEDSDPAALVARAEASDEVDIKEAPASALLLVAGRLLELPADAAPELGDYEKMLAKVAAFCDGRIALSRVRARFVEREFEDEVQAETEPDAVVELKFRLDDTEYESELVHDPELVDVSFMNEFDDHLESIGEDRRLCPLVELMDDTARYVFHLPEKVEEAELQEVIAATDFEGG